MADTSESHYSQDMSSYQPNYGMPPQYGMNGGFNGGGDMGGLGEITAASQLHTEKLDLLTTNTIKSLKEAQKRDEDMLELLEEMHSNLKKASPGPPVA